MPLYNTPVAPTRTTATTGTATTNSLSTTASSLVAANSNRKGLTVFNNLSVSIFVDTTNSVSSTAFMVAIPPGAYFELPASDALYTGALFAVLPSGTGSAFVREFV